MRRALILVLASVASAKDPPPQCEGFGSCLMTGNIGAAVAHGVKEAAALVSARAARRKAVRLLLLRECESWFIIYKCTFSSVWVGPVSRHGLREWFRV